MRFPIRASIAAVSFVLVACSGAGRSTEADVQALNGIRQRIQAAENSGLADSMGFAFADDIVVMPPNGPAAVGPTANTEMMRGFFQTFAVQIEYTSREVAVDRDWAFDRGSYRHTLTPRAGGAPMPETGNYLWLYHRANDGTWKASRIIWNSDVPVAHP